MTHEERDALVRAIVDATSISRRADIEDLKKEMLLRFGDHEPRIEKLEEFHGAAKTVGRVSVRVGGIIASVVGFLKLVGLI